VTQEVTTSSRKSLRWKSFEMNGSAPEMTPWSYPNSNPERIVTRPTSHSHFDKPFIPTPACQPARPSSGKV